MTKTISLADDAYEAFAAVKGEGESFSDLARRAARELALRRMFDRGLKPLFTRKQAEEFKRKIRRWRAEGAGKRRGWDD
jgi:predicted CopG family antitoxin